MEIAGQAQLPREHKVQIISGTFPGFIGTVTGELPERGQVTVMVSFFGKPIAVKADRAYIKVIR
jgi:transcription antitermination factor NusG